MTCPHEALRKFCLNQEDHPRSNPWEQLCSGVWAKIPFPANPELPAFIHRSFEPNCPCRPSTWGKVGGKSMELLRRSPGACPMSSTANWMSHFIFSKNRDFSSQMQNSCCTSQVVARIQYSSTHTTKLAGRLKHKKTTLCFCEYYFFFSTYSHHYFSLFFPSMSDLFTVLLFTLA